MVKNIGGKIESRLRGHGNGIQAEVREEFFNPSNVLEYPLGN
jgi:hypothetical protein